MVYDMLSIVGSWLLRASFELKSPDTVVQVEWKRTLEVDWSAYPGICRLVLLTRLYRVCQTVRYNFGIALLDKLRYRRLGS